MFEKRAPSKKNNVQASDPSTNVTFNGVTKPCIAGRGGWMHDDLVDIAKSMNLSVPRSSNKQTFCDAILGAR
jgi:hypothetical protein